MRAHQLIESAADTHKEIQGPLQSSNCDRFYSALDMTLICSAKSNSEIILSVPVMFSLSEWGNSKN